MSEDFIKVKGLSIKSTESKVSSNDGDEDPGSGCHETLEKQFTFMEDNISDTPKLGNMAQQSPEKTVSLYF